jgi:hypothetical protein
MMPCVKCVGEKGFTHGWGMGRLTLTLPGGRFTRDFLGPLTSGNPSTGNNRKSIGLQNKFDLFSTIERREDLNW